MMKIDDDTHDDDDDYADVISISTPPSPRTSSSCEPINIDPPPPF